MTAYYSYYFDYLLSFLNCVYNAYSKTQANPWKTIKGMVSLLHTVPQVLNYSEKHNKHEDSSSKHAYCCPQILAIAENEAKGEYPSWEQTKRIQAIGTTCKCVINLVDKSLLLNWEESNMK